MEKLATALNAISLELRYSYVIISACGRLSA
jgi:hypothetical protein